MKDIYLNTPLQLAYFNNHQNVVTYLSTPSNKQGRNEDISPVIHLPALNTTTITGHTSLACYAGHLDVVEYLSNNALCDVDSKFKNGWTALHLAAEAGHLEVVKHLVEGKGCDINVKSNQVTPLYVAYRKHWNDGIDLLMNKLSCDVNVQDSDGNTLLHLACKRDEYSLVKRLISHPKCNINILNKDNETPLLLTIGLNGVCATDIVRLLVKTNKCDLNIRYLNGNSLLHRACTCRRSLQLVKLLTPVCDFNAENNEGVRPIHLAA